MWTELPSMNALGPKGSDVRKDMDVILKTVKQKKDKGADIADQTAQLTAFTAAITAFLAAL